MAGKSLFMRLAGSSSRVIKFTRLAALGNNPAPVTACGDEQNLQPPILGADRKGSYLHLRSHLVAGS